METTPNLTNIEPVEKPGFTTSERNKLLIYIAVMLAATFVVSSQTTPGVAVHLDGQIATEAEIQTGRIKTIFLGIPFFGFIIGSLVSLLPYKKLPYTKKYLRASLITILALYVIMFLLGIRNLILF